MSQLVYYVCFDNCRLVFNSHILLLQKCLYISLSSFLKNTLIELQLQSHSFLPKIFYFFSYKNLFLESKSIGVHKVRGSFRCTRSEPMGCRILGEERNHNFLPVQWRCFLSKDSVYALQPRLYLSLPNLFFPCSYCMIQCIVDLCGVN